MASFQKQADDDIKAALAKTMLENPGMSADFAMQKVSEMLLKDNPFVPPKGCPVNDLPNELLAHIFYVGMQMEQESADYCDDEDEDDDIDIEDAWTDEESSDDEGMDVDGKPEKADDHMSIEDHEHRCDSRCDDHDDDDDDEGESLPPFQVLVSHVCKKWRDAAINEPLLWTTIEFTLGYSLDASKAWLERSKGLPLDITINASKDDDEEYPDSEEELYADDEGNTVAILTGLSSPSPPTTAPSSDDKPDADYPVCLSKDDVGAILDLIVPHLQRWQRLHISTSLYETMFYALTRLSQCPPASLLETLQLYQYDSGSEDLEAEIFTPQELRQHMVLFQGQIPKLHNLALWGVHVDWESLLPSMSEVRQLELAYHANDIRPTFATFAAMLQANPNMTALSLCGSGPLNEPVEKWGSVPISLPSVVDLVLAQHDVEYICQLFPLLHIPTVRNVTLDFDGMDYTDFVEILLQPTSGQKQSLLERLERLKIDGLPCSATHKTAVLKQLTNLKSLHLNCISDEEEEFFSQILASTKEGGDLFCPNLDTLITRGMTGKQIREFLELRTKAGKRIGKVVMSRQDDIESRDMKWFENPEHVDEFNLFVPSDSEEEMIEIDDDDFSDLDE